MAPLAKPVRSIPSARRPSGLRALNPRAGCLGIQTGGHFLQGLAGLKPGFSLPYEAPPAHVRRGAIRLPFAASFGFDPRVVISWSPSHRGNSSLSWRLEPDNVVRFPIWWPCAMPFAHSPETRD